MLANILKYIICIALSLLSIGVQASEEPVDLSFRDFYRLPIGARGLEPTDLLLAMDGRRVTLRGYVVRTEEGSAILAPHPVILGHDDEALADDLPAATAWLHGPMSEGISDNRSVSLTGRLAVGPLDEADGRRSQVRLYLDAPRSPKPQP